MSERFQVREATHADTDQILQVWLTPDVFPSSTDHAEALGRLIDHPTSALLLAEREGRAVGTLIAAWDGWRGGLYRLMVVPEVRRLGAAAALVRAAERYLGSAGCSRISVHVLGHDPSAVAFWAAVGYEVDEPMRRYLRTV